MGTTEIGQKLGKYQETAIQIQVLWDVTPCRLVNSHRRFKESYRLVVTRQAAPDEPHCLVNHAEVCWTRRIKKHEMHKSSLVNVRGKIVWGVQYEQNVRDVRYEITN
jgi:hypothetical protein